MFVFPTAESLQKWLAVCKANGQSIGFVPTMGTLHQGHLSLVKQSQKNTDITVVSIFVNPTQFNDKGDLERYPRNEQEDLAMLHAQNTDAAFLPSVEEVYPDGETPDKTYEFEHLATVMEGKHRPGHFDGVAQVVKRFLDITAPDKLFMGQKDYQQVAIINKVIELENLSVELVACPTIRENNGLAMSSRNKLLTPTEQENASNIYKALTNLKNNYKETEMHEALEQAITDIENNYPLKVEYLEIANAYDLTPAKSWDDFENLVACTAVFYNNVRLIDNIVIP